MDEACRSPVTSFLIGRRKEISTSWFLGGVRSGAPYPLQQDFCQYTCESRAQSFCHNGIVFINRSPDSPLSKLVVLAPKFPFIRTLEKVRPRLPCIFLRHTSRTDKAHMLHHLRAEPVPRETHVVSPFLDDKICLARLVFTQHICQPFHVVPWVDQSLRTTPLLVHSMQAS